MNDWPADPKLDTSLRDLVNKELVAARTDAVGLTLRKRARGGRQQLAFAAVAALAVVVLGLAVLRFRRDLAPSDRRRRGANSEAESLQP